MKSFNDSVQKVVSSQMCTGCGLCAAMLPGLEMKSRGGFMRPVLSGSDSNDRKLIKTFNRSCPGKLVRAVKNPSATRHPTLGPIVGIWEAYALDETFRDKGSSGGVLSSLSAWMLERGIASTVSGASKESTNPRRTVPVTITTKEQALKAAGSRYAPVSALSGESALKVGNAVVGKPCEVSAMRSYENVEGRDNSIKLSFFCAGTPSQEATDSLIEKLGIPKTKPLKDLWYRGNGWPGNFTAIAKDGQRVETSYDESWGAALGPTVQWRCRVCPDGVGESSDITAGDFWEADENGYPKFSDMPGRSVLIARTSRGFELVQAAEREGVIALRPADPEAVTKMQPYQFSRRRYLFGRLLASRIFLGAAPRVRGFGIIKATLGEPIRTYRELRGSISRIRHRRRAGIKS